MKNLNKSPETKLIGVCPLGFKIKEDIEMLTDIFKQRRPVFNQYSAIPINHCPKPKTAFELQNVLVHFAETTPEELIIKLQSVKENAQKIQQKIIDLIHQNYSLFTKNVRNLQYFLIAPDGKVLKTPSAANLSKEIYAKLSPTEQDLTKDLRRKITGAEYVDSIIKLNRYVSIIRTPTEIKINPDQIPINSNQDKAINQLMEIFEKTA